MQFFKRPGTTRAEQGTASFTISVYVTKMNSCTGYNKTTCFSAGNLTSAAAESMRRSLPVQKHQYQLIQHALLNGATIPARVQNSPIS
jgi:hypothetical protein